MVQKHLTYEQMTDFGCFYTPKKFVDLLVEKIKYNISNYKDFVFIDTSCGYGAFLQSLNDCQCIGVDIDAQAIEMAKKLNEKAKYIITNSLKDVSQENFGLSEKSFIIVGNPPYNDTTSKVKQEIKQQEPCDIDEDLKTRDLGISFLLSYNKLQADYVAVLHPLSYMIKRANYKLLSPFFNNYCLIDHAIVSSQEFSLTSKTTGFPIIIALYKRDGKGMSYSDILNKTFVTSEGKKFTINYTSVSKYISKYPSKFKNYKKGDLLFFTMRDINALKRSKTFIKEYGANSIIIDLDKIRFYCYVDVFKKYIHHIPYYLGNVDVFINYEEFEKIEDVFITRCLEDHKELEPLFPNLKKNYDFKKIEKYFQIVLGENYVY